MPVTEERGADRHAGAAGRRPPPEPHLRSAGPDDARRVFEWRNLPEIVALSTLRRPVEWDEHLAWFEETLRHPARRLLLVVERERRPIGTVRFDRAESATARISVYLIPGETGQGFGSSVIRAGCRLVSSRWPSLARIDALVRVDNPRAEHAFLRAGFLAVDEVIEPDHHTLRLGR